MFSRVFSDENFCKFSRQINFEIVNTNVVCSRKFFDDNFCKFFSSNLLDNSQPSCFHKYFSMTIFANFSRQITLEINSQPSFFTNIFRWQFFANFSRQFNIANSSEIQNRFFHDFFPITNSEIFLVKLKLSLFRDNKDRGKEENRIKPVLPKSPQNVKSRFLKHIP